MPTGSTSHHSPESQHSSSEHSQILRVTLAVSLLVCFLIGFFSIYLCRYKIVNARRNRRNSANEVSTRPQSLDPGSGLDSMVIASFPILTYSSVKSLQEERNGLECSICLGEFDDNDVLRLLTACSHVFHIGCIDLWLKSHTTCPICRRELNPQEEPHEVRIMVTVAEDHGSVEVEGVRGDEDEQQQQQQQQRRISFKEDEEGAGDGNGNVEYERSRRSGDLDRLPRSNSTGHSSRWREDRFILRLPEDVKERIYRERNWTESCIDLLGDRIKDDEDIRRSGFSDRGPNRT